VAGKGEEVETVPGGLIMQAERSASGGDEIRVEDPLEPDHFFKNQAV
jgi:hypothetical protein